MDVNNTKLSLELLISFGAGHSYLSFVTAHGLEKYSLSDLEIEGDYRGYIWLYIQWVHNKLSPDESWPEDTEGHWDCKRDRRGNIISRVHSRMYSDGVYVSSNEHTYTYDKNNNMIRHQYGDYIELYAYSRNNKIISYSDSRGHHYSTINLPDNVLCQAFKNGIMVLEIKLKQYH